MNLFEIICLIIVILPAIYLIYLLSYLLVMCVEFEFKGDLKNDKE